MATKLTENLFGLRPSSFSEKSSQSKKREIFGLGYPLHKDKTQGGFFTKVTGIELIKGAITQLLKTEKGERVMQPNFGCSLRRFLFQPIDESLFLQIRSEINSSFNRYIKGARILSLSVGPAADKGTAEGGAIKVVLRVQLLAEDLIVFDIPVTLS